MGFYAAMFLALAVFSALFGFVGIVPGAATEGKVLFFVFAVAFVACLVVGSRSRQRRR